MIGTVLEAAAWLAFAAATPFIGIGWLFLVLAEGRWSPGYVLAAFAIPLAWCAIAFALVFRTGPSGEGLLLGAGLLIAFFLLRRLARRIFSRLRGGAR